MKKSSPYSMRSISHSSMNMSKLADKEFYQGYDDNVKARRPTPLRTLITKTKGGVEGLRMKAVLSLPRNQGVTITVKPTPIVTPRSVIRPSVNGSGGRQSKGRPHMNLSPSTRSNY
jgi:hypothetical protein